jgi:uncharacterized SAM-binding protein YcdF (DUF218 family)
MGDLLWLLLPNGVHLLALLTVVAIGVSRSRSRRLSRWRAAAWTAVCVVWVLTTPAIANQLLRSLEGPLQPPPKPEHDERTRILVLASGQLLANDGTAVARLDENGWERAAAGVALWRRTGGVLVYSGGPDGDPQVSLAASMAAVAQAMGVPASAIVQSPSGSNTFDEMAGARAEMAGDGPRWLVTSASHMPRSQRVAACLGLALKPYAVGPRQIVNVTWVSWLPDPTAPEVFRATLHEWVGMAYYRLRHGC